MTLDALLWQAEHFAVRRRAARHRPLQALAELLREGNISGTAARRLALCVELGLLTRARQTLAEIADPPALPIGLQLAWLEGDFTSFDRLANDLANPALLSQLSPSMQNKCLSLLAQRAPGLALAAVSALRHRPLCAPAIAQRAGAEMTATKWRRRTLWRLHADYLLIDANLTDSPARKLESINAYLARHGLSALRLIDPSQPPSVNNVAGIACMERGSPPGGAAVSVIVPSHDNQHHIRASLDSLLQQTVPPQQIIVVDDASTDETPRIVAELARAHPSIQLIRLAQNRGAYLARNVGIVAARTEFVGFHDADDFAHPQRLQLALAPMLDDPQVHATTSRCARLSDDGVFGEARVWPMTRWTPISLVMRRGPAMRRVGCFEPARFGADSEYTARLRTLLGEEHHRLVPQPLAFFGQRAGSLTTTGTAGFDVQGRSAPRIRYQEEWTERHLAALLGTLDLVRHCGADPASESVIDGDLPGAGG